MKDKKKIKRRTYLDIGKREKVKDYKDKRTKDGERFQENIVEKKSKLNNFEREIKSTDKKGGLSLSQKQIEKHRAKEERTGDSNNLEKITTESRQVKEVIIEEKNLDIGARVKASNYLGKRVHEKDRFDESIIKKKTKLKHEKTKVTSKKRDEYKDRKGYDKGSLDNLQDKSINVEKVKKQKQINNLKQKIEDPKHEDLDKEIKSNTLFKDDANNLIIPNKEDDEVRVEDFEERASGVDSFKNNSKKKDYYKRKLVYDNQKKINKKDGKLTTDDVKDLKAGMANKTGEKVPSQTTALDGKVEKQYRKSESKLIQKRKKASKLYHKPKYDKTGKFVGGISGASYLSAEYIRAGSDENVAIDASEKGLYLNASMTRHAQNKLQRQRRSPIKLERKLALKHQKNLARAEYKTEIKGLKNEKDFQKKTAYKKLIKRRQMKKKIYEEHNIAIGFKDRLKKGMEKYEKGRSKEFNIGKPVAEKILNAVGEYFSNEYIEIFATDIGDWKMEIINTDGESYHFRGSLCADFEIDGIDLSNLIRDGIGIKNLYIFDGNNKPDKVNKITIEYNRVTKIKPKELISESVEYVTWDYKESLTIDRETETIEHIQNIGSGCIVSRKFQVQGGVENLLDDLDGDSLFEYIEGNPSDVIENPREIKGYKITIELEKDGQRIIMGSFDKKGLPEDWEEFAETILDFILFYGLGEILDPSVYNLIKRRKGEYIYCSVSFDDSYKTYYYLTDDDSIEVGDLVMVPAGRDNHLAMVEVVNIEYFQEENAPLAISKTKKIVRKCTEEDFE